MCFPIHLIQGLEMNLDTFLYLLHEEEHLYPTGTKWSFVLKQLSTLSSLIAPFNLDQDQIQDVLIFCLLWKTETMRIPGHPMALIKETEYIKEIYNNLSRFCGPPNEKYQRVIEKVSQNIGARNNRRPRNNKGARSVRNNKGARSVRNNKNARSVRNNKNARKNSRRSMNI